MRKKVFIDVVRGLEDGDDLGLEDRDLRPEILVKSGTRQRRISWAIYHKAKPRVSMRVFTAVGLTMENVSGNNSPMLKTFRNYQILSLAREDSFRY